MKISFVLFVCAILVHVNAWVGIIRGDPNTAHLGDCYTTNRNIGALKLGEVKRIEGKCAIATCRSNRDIRLTGCGSIHVMPPYRVVPGDLSKPFPQCCHEIVGPSNSTEDAQEEFERDIDVASKTTLVDVSLNHGSNLI